MSDRASDPVVRSPQWEPNSASKKCRECSSGFTLTNRRHHCRACGNLICESCSKYRQLNIDEIAPGAPPSTPKSSKGNKAQRVCPQCFTERGRRNTFASNEAAGDEIPQIDTRARAVSSPQKVSKSKKRLDLSTNDFPNAVSSDRLPKQAGSSRTEHSTQEYGEGAGAASAKKSASAKRPESATKPESAKKPESANKTYGRRELSTADFEEDEKRKNEPAKQMEADETQKKETEAARTQLEEKEKLMQQMQRQEMARMEDWEKRLLVKETELETQQKRLEERAREKEIGDKRGAEQKAQKAQQAQQKAQEEMQQQAQQAKPTYAAGNSAMQLLTQKKTSSLVQRTVHRRLTSRERGQTEARYKDSKPEKHEDVVLSFPLSYTPSVHHRSRERWFATKRFDVGGCIKHLGTFKAVLDAEKSYEMAENSGEQDAARFVRKACAFEDDYVVTMLGLKKRPETPGSPKLLTPMMSLVDEMDIDPARQIFKTARCLQSVGHQLERALNCVFSEGASTDSTNKADIERALECRLREEFRSLVYRVQAECEQEPDETRDESRSRKLKRSASLGGQECSDADYCRVVAKSIALRIHVACGLQARLTIMPSLKCILVTVEADPHDLMVEAQHIDFKVAAENRPFRTDFGSSDSGGSTRGRFNKGVVDGFTNSSSMELELAFVEKYEKKLKVGAQIEADYMSSGTFYPGKIAEWSDDGTLVIHYDDGSEEKGVLPSLVRKPGQYGDYEALIECKKLIRDRVDDDGAIWPSIAHQPYANEEASAQKEALLREEALLDKIEVCIDPGLWGVPEAGELQEGEAVEIEHEGAGGKNWYPGKVVSVNGNGSYDILYADGDREPRVGKDRIRRASDVNCDVHTILAMYGHDEEAHADEGKVYLSPYTTFVFDKRFMPLYRHSMLHYRDEEAVRFKDALTHRQKMLKTDEGLLAVAQDSSVFRTKDRINLVNSIIARHLNLPVLKHYKLLNDSFGLHERSRLQELKDNWAYARLVVWCPYPQLQQPIGRIRDYFGEKIALYFAFLQFYTNCIVPIAMLGLATFCVNYVFEHHLDTPPLVRGWVLIFFGAAVSIWSTCYTEFWKRRQFFLNVWWGMTDFKVGEPERPEFQGVMRKSLVDDKYENFHSSMDTLYTKMAMGITVVVLMIMIVIVAVFSFLFFVKGSGEGGAYMFDSITRHFVRKVDPLSHEVSYVSNEHFMVYNGTPIGSPLCGLINAIQIFVLNSVYKSVAQKLNDFENHRTESEYENNLIVKVFLFQFVNSFSSFVYIAFAKRFIEWGDPQIMPSALGVREWAQYLPEYDSDHSGTIDLLEYMNATKTTRLTEGFVLNYTDTNERELTNGCIGGDCIGELGTALASVFFSAIVIQVS
jgi:hypothetical protein